MKTTNNVLVRVVSATAAILMIPLIAMQFSKDVIWTISDFIIAGIVLMTTGFLYELVVKTSGKNRAMFTLILVVLFLLVWAELAVGIFGTPFAGS